MSSRYYDRDYQRYEDPERERGGSYREERGFLSRTGDEVRSWFGDEEAERMRRMDEQRYGREGTFGRNYSTSSSERESGGSSFLMRLRDTDFHIPDEQDIRGRKVLDQDGNDIGTVDDLIIEPRQQKVRFLQVTSGGFLGLGGRMLLIPANAIARVNRDFVEVSQMGGSYFGGSRYNPPLLIDRGYSGGSYGTAGTSGSYGASTSMSQQKGKGPRGYRRSDDRIKEDVNDRLTDYPYLDASDIEVTVISGEVTLSGTVNNRNDKRLAEDIAEQVSGVTNVQNNLRAQGQQTTTPTAGTTAAGAAAGAGRSKSTTA